MGGKIKMGKSIIGITMGDPAGIGAEIIVKALKYKRINEECIPVIFGDYEVILDAINFCHTKQKINLVDKDLTNIVDDQDTINLLNFNYFPKNGWEYKKVAAKCGEAAYDYIISAIDYALNKKISAVVTGPINKESIHLAGKNYCGHTEIFAQYTNTKNYAMLLTSKDLKVIHVTTHCPLSDVPKKVTRERVLEVIKLASQAMKLLGIKNPKIGVAGLNPHSSENGLFGHEEEVSIMPAINDAKELGLDVTGPESPDTVFVKALAGQYDIVVAMYHDQGHIPLKLSGFKLDLRTNKFISMSGVNCTIGLPIIRTSVDHGTAFGKAGEGRANEESMIDAIEMAITMAKNKIDCEKE